MQHERFELSVLGPLRIADAAGNSVETITAQTKRAGLLAYLCLARNPGATHRGRLVTVFWPELSEDAARNSLNQAVHFLRRSLGDQAIVTTPQAVTVDDTRIGCDAHEFERLLDRGSLAEAVALYGGEFLCGFTLPHAAEFARWLDDERERLKQRYVDALAKLATEATRLGDTAKAIDWARRAAAVLPLDARCATTLMRALAAAGRRSEALHHAALYRKLVESELEADVDPEVAELERALRNASTTEQAPAPVPINATLTGATRPDPEQITPPAVGPSPSDKRRHAFLAGFGALSFISVVTGMLWIDKASSVATPQLPANRVFVVAFANATGDSALAELGSLAADYITDGVLRSGVLQVVDPATAYYALRDQHAKPIDISAPGQMLRVARSVKAGTVVWGKIYRVSDSTIYEARISDVSGGKLLGSVRVAGEATASKAPAIEELRQRIAGLLAARLDVSLTSLGSVNLPPPRLDAYIEYSKGLSEFRREEDTSGLKHFLAASRLDSTFFLPLSWAIYAAGNNDLPKLRDSLVAAMAKVRNKLSPLDRYALETHLQNLDPPLARLPALEAAERLAPGSNWSYMLGFTELKLLHPHRALRALRHVNRASGWARDWFDVDIVLMQAQHLVGDYAGELAVAEEALARADSDGITDTRDLHFARVNALAGLGDSVRLPDAIRELRASTTELGSWLLAWNGLALRHYGFAALSRQLLAFADTVAKREQETDHRETARRLWQMLRAYYRGDDSEAVKLAREALAIDSIERRPPSFSMLRVLAIMAARSQRTSEVEKLLAWTQPRLAENGRYITPWPVKEENQLRRERPNYDDLLLIDACVAAAVGDAAKASGLLRRAANAGAFEYPLSVYMDPVFDGIRNTREFKAVFSD